MEKINELMIFIVNIMFAYTPIIMVVFYLGILLFKKKGPRTTDCRQRS